MPRFSTWLALILIAISLGLLVLFGYTAHERDLTALETVFLQFVSLLVGLGGSYVWGRKASEKMIKLQIRSAFRRLLSLYASLRRVATIAEVTESNDAQRRLDIIAAIVEEQTAMADDALEDWADVDPDSVANLKKQVENEDSKRRVEWRT